MPDYSELNDVLRLLSECQDADDDNRQATREAHLFVSKRNGQWEPYWWNRTAGRPRYTFDMTTPVIDQIAGEMEQSDFDIKITPASGGASKETAETLDGLVRNIENISKAGDVYELAGRNSVTAGIDGWCIKQKYVDGDSFDQDLIISPIANFVDSAWLGPFKEPDASDSQHGFILEAIPKNEYDEKYPEGSGKSVSNGAHATAYSDKTDQIIIGLCYWIEEVPRTLLKLSSGRIVEEADVMSVLDELAQQGETVVASRVRKKSVVKCRQFDGMKWLNKPQKTVFNQIPIVPIISNFKILEDKLIYHGAVEKLMDPQRVFNYSKSREVEEGSLAPRAKYWMTKAQTKGHEDTLGTLNTNSDPIQYFNADSALPGPPMQSGGPQINPGLKSISDDMQGITRQVAGLFDASMGDSPNLQSGVAIEKLQNKGNTGTQKYFSAMERAIARTARILVDAIPQVYEGDRVERILKQDGSFDMVQLNQRVLDQQTMRLVTINDLSVGKYDVVCKAGPSFDSRQQETVTAFSETAALDPTVLELGGDIFYNNMASPGMDLLGERKRQQLLQAGLIPENQLTDEERAEIQAAQQAAQQNPPPPDPATILAQAETKKAEAQTGKVMVEAQAKAREQDRQDMQAQADIRFKEQELGLRETIEMMKAQGAMQQQLLSSVTAQADILKTIKDAMGADTIISPAAAAAYAEQARNLNQAVS